MLVLKHALDILLSMNGFVHLIYALTVEWYKLEGTVVKLFEKIYVCFVSLLLLFISQLFVLLVIRVIIDVIIFIGHLLLELFPVIICHLFLELLLQEEGLVGFELFLLHLGLIVHLDNVHNLLVRLEIFVVRQFLCHVFFLPGVLVEEFQDDIQLLA
jgi:hypothetical protein